MAPQEEIQVITKKLETLSRDWHSATPLGRALIQAQMRTGMALRASLVNQFYAQGTQVSKASYTL